MKYFTSLFLLIHMLSLHILAVVHLPHIRVYPHALRPDFHFTKPLLARDERFQRDILWARNTNHKPLSGRKGRTISIAKALHIVLKKTVAVQNDGISLAGNAKLSSASALGVISFLDGLVSFPHYPASFQHLLNSFTPPKTQEVSQSLQRPTAVMAWFSFLGWYP